MSTFLFRNASRAAVAFASIGLIASAALAEQPEFRFDILDSEPLDIYVTGDLDVEGNITNLQKSGITGSLKLAADAPVILPISVNPFYLNGQTARWGDPFSWNNPLLVVGNTAAIADNFKGILRLRKQDGTFTDRTFSVAKTFESLEALGSQGPTERRLDLWGAGVTIGYPGSYGLEPSSIDIGVDTGLVLKWDVTLPAGSNVVLDQQSTLELFEVKSGAILSVDQDGNFFSGRGSLTTRRTFVNHGFITGLTGSSQGLFHNDGTIFIDNGFSAVGSTGSAENGDFEQKFFNTGEIRVNSGLLTIQGAATNLGTIAIQGGSFSNSADFRNAGLIKVRGGGVVLAPNFYNEGRIDWYSGSLNGSTNNGLLRVVDGGEKFIQGNTQVHNTGTVEHSGDESILFDIDFGIPEFRNDGLYVLSGGGGFAAREPDTGEWGRFYNYGTLRKTGGDTSAFSGSNQLLNRGGTIEVLGGTLRAEGYFIQTSGITALSGGDLAFGSTASFTGGEIIGTGTITGNVSNGAAILAPGSSPGTLTIDGNYTHGSNARLVIEIAGLADGEFDVLDVTGIATLNGGTLEVVLLPGDYDIPMLTDFDVLRAGTLFGSFSNFILPTDEFGVPLFAAIPDPLTGTFTLTALQDIDMVPEPMTLALLVTGGLLAGSRRRRAA